MTDMPGRLKGKLLSRTMRAMGKLFVGSLLAKLLTLLALPILTRLYLPEDFGITGVFITFVTLLLPVVTMQFNHAIPIPRTDAMAANLATLALISSLAVSLVLAVVLMFFADPMLRAFDAASLAEVWWLIALGAFLMGVASITSMWQVRKRRYSSLTRGALFESALGNGIKLVLGLWTQMALGLMLGQTVNMTARFILFTPKVLREVIANRRQIGPHRLMQAARQYASFPAYRMPSQFISSVGMQLPVLYLASVHGVAVAGQFSLAMLAISMPLNLFGLNLGKAFYAEASFVGRKDAATIHSAMIQIIKLLGAVGLVLAAVLAFGGPSLFGLVFGFEWLLAGQFAAVLSITLAVRFVSAPLMDVLSTFRREDIYLWIDIQRTLAAAGAFSIAFTLELPPVLTVGIYSGVMVIHHLIGAAIVFRVVSSAAK